MNRHIKKNEELVEAIKRQAAREQEARRKQEVGNASVAVSRENPSPGELSSGASLDEASTGCASSSASSSCELSSNNSTLLSDTSPADIPLGDISAHDASPDRSSQSDTSRDNSSQSNGALPDGASPSDISMVGLGIDLLEIERMEQAIKRTPRILERVFTQGERDYASSKARPVVHYAVFFAAREAVLKALGCGFNGVEFSDVEIAHEGNGRPVAILHGKARAIAEQQAVREIQISLSHTHQHAVASAVILKEHLPPPAKTRNPDPSERITRQFKELRPMMDDLIESSSILSKEDMPEHDGSGSENRQHRQADGQENE